MTGNTAKRSVSGTLSTWLTVDGGEDDTVKQLYVRRALEAVTVSITPLQRIGLYNFGKSPIRNRNGCVLGIAATRSVELNA